MAPPTTAAKHGTAEHDNVLVALDRADDALEHALQGVGSGQWTLPTPCAVGNVRQVANHVVAAGDYFIALIQGMQRATALENSPHPTSSSPTPFPPFAPSDPRRGPRSPPREPSRRSATTSSPT